MTARDDGGQATVEFALALPLLAVLLLAVVQVGLVVRDQVVLVHAAREAARAVAIRETSGGGTVGARGLVLRAEAGGLRPRADSLSGSGAGPGELARIARQAARSAAGRTLRDDRLTVEVVETGGRVTVRLGYASPLGVPLLRLSRKDVRLVAFAQIHREID